MATGFGWLLGSELSKGRKVPVLGLIGFFIFFMIGLMLIVQDKMSLSSTWTYAGAILVLIGFAIPIIAERI